MSPILISLQKSEKPPEDLLFLALDLARRLLRKGFSKLTINRLLYFLQSYVYFDNRENYRKFEEEIESITEKNKVMGIKEIFTQLLKEEGREEGMEKGKSALVTNLLLKTNHSLSEIADLAETTVDFVISVKNGLSS